MPTDEDEMANRADPGETALSVSILKISIVI